MSACPCFPGCVHILVFAHNLNQYTQEGGIKAANQLQKAEKQQGGLVHQMFCQLHSPFNQCNKQLFQHLSLSPPGHDSSSPLRTGVHQSVASPCCPSFIISAFFPLPMRAFKPDLFCPWKGLLWVTKTANQSQIGPTGLGYVSLILNDRKARFWNCCC